MNREEQVVESPYIAFSNTPPHMMPRNSRTLMRKDGGFVLFPQHTIQIGTFLVQTTGRLFTPSTRSAQERAEAVVRAFERKGDDYPLELEGDGTTLLYDLQNCRLIASVDRFNVSRLLYFHTGDLFAVADNYAPLFDLGVPQRPNLRKQILYIASNYRRFEDLRSETFYLNIHKLPYAGRLIYQDRRWDVTQYWQLALRDLSRLSETDLQREYLTYLERSVASRLSSCARPAFTLSSGMDSSSVVCFATQLLQEMVPLYTTTYPEKTEYNEESDITVMAERFGSSWRRVLVSGDQILPAMEDSLRQAEEPYATITQLMHYFVTRQAKADGHDSLFSGLGGDEANSGEIEEYLFFFADLERRGLHDQLREHMIGWHRFHNHPLYPKNETVLRTFFQQQIDFSTPGNNLPNPAYHQNYLRAFRAEAVAGHLSVPLLGHPYHSYLRNKLYQDLFFETIPTLLQAERANSKMHELPTLYPYLEPDVMAYGFSIPLSLKYDRGMSKSLLRRALRGKLPDQVLDNGCKRGWNAPFNQWLTSAIGPHLRQILTEPTRRQQELYDLDTLKLLYQEHRNGTANHMMFFWQLLSYELWYDLHINSSLNHHRQPPVPQ